MKLFRCSRCSYSSSRLFKVKDHFRASHKQTPPRPAAKVKRERAAVVDQQQEKEENKGDAGYPGVHPGQLQQLMVAMGLGLGAIPNMSALFTQKQPHHLQPGEEMDVSLGKASYEVHDFLALEHSNDGDRRRVSSPMMSPDSPVHHRQLGGKASHNQVCSGFGEQTVAN